MTITVDEFLSKVKKRITLPANQVLLSNSDILSMADDAMRERLVPLILSVNQNFFVQKVEESTVASQGEYSLPSRTIGRGLRDLKMKRGSDDNTVFNLALVALEDAHYYADIGTPSGFFFQGDKIVIVPKPVTSDFTMIQYYDQQPSKLIELNGAAKVASIAGDVVTCETVPSSFASNTVIDFVEGKSGCSLKAFDISIVSVSGLDITFATGEVPTSLVAGDYISPAGFSPVLQVPDEASPVLETWVGERILYAVGDFEGAQLLAARSVIIEENLKKILSPRVQGEPTKIVNRNGLLRGRGFNSWRIRGGFYGS